MDAEATWDLLADFEVQEQRRMADSQQDIPIFEQELPIEKLLRLWDELVQAVTEDVMAEVQSRLEFRELLRNFCRKAPRAAETLGNSIIESVRRGDDPKDVMITPAAQSSAPDRSIAQSRKHKAKDISCRPPIYARVANAYPTLATGEKRQSTRSAGEKHAAIGSLVDGNVSQVSRKPKSTSSKEVECGNSKFVNPAARNDLVDANNTQGSAKPQSVLTPEEDENFSESANRVDPEANGISKVVCGSVLDAVPSTTGRESTSTESVEQSGALKSPKLGEFAQSTPARQIKADPIESPQTEEIHRDKIPTSLESVSSSPGLMGAAQENVWMLTDQIIEAVRIIHGLSKHQDGLPRDVHVTILQALRGPRQDMLVSSDWSSDWSSGSTWVDILEAGSIESQKVTILRMLEYIGAWEWYDAQVRLLQESGMIRTRKNKPASRKLVATHVLDKIQQSGKYIKSLGTLTMENDERTDTTLDGQNTLTERISHKQRQRIKLQLSRGQRLSTRLVKELGLGILFSPNIWDYTKKDTEHLEQLIKCVQGDPKHMMLLQILSKQLEMFIIEGRTDIRALLASLLAEGLLSESDQIKITSQLPFAPDLASAEALNTAVDRLKWRISNNVLGKETLRSDDIVSVRGGTEFTCDMFEKLRHNEWFNAWLLLAGMEMSDKPSFTKCHPSIPLDETFGKRGLMRRIPRPLAGLKRKIEEWRRKVDESVRLVYLSPLNHHCDHFTALEINEQDGKIFHYDSNAPKGVINGIEKSTRVRELVQEEFGHLNFEFVEAPTPQQDDTCSCGPMVVRNIRRRMFGFSVGGWQDKVDPDRVRMDMVEDFEACISDNALWGKPSPAESRQPLVLPEVTPQKSPEKRSAQSEPEELDTPTRRPKRIRSSSR